jgi:hypothetical protein
MNISGPGCIILYTQFCVLFVIVSLRRKHQATNQTRFKFFNIDMTVGNNVINYHVANEHAFHRNLVGSRFSPDKYLISYSNSYIFLLKIFAILHAFNFKRESIVVDLTIA